MAKHVKPRSKQSKRGPHRLVRCGAKSRRTGKPCTNWAVVGSKRCRMHGGTHPKGGKAPQAKTALKHGLFAKTLSDEERKRFAEAFGEAMDDPALQLLADATFLRVKAATVAKRADASGMYVAKQSGVTRTEPMIGMDGQPVMYRPFDDSDERRPVMKTVTTVAAERVDVIGPVSELIMRAGRLTEAAVQVKKKDEDDKRKAGGGTKEIDRDDAAAIMKDVFGGAGALEKKQGEADGAIPTPSPDDDEGD